MRPFIDSLTELGVAFTELQVLKLAASFRLFPFREYHKFGHSTGRQMVSSQTKLGYFGRIIRCNTRPTDWRSLEISRCLQDMVRSLEYSVNLRLTVLLVLNGQLVSVSGFNVLVRVHGTKRRPLAHVRSLVLFCA